jgi:hypothetical protein
MPAGEALERLAILGFWNRPDHPIVQARLAELSKRLGRDVDSLAKALARDPTKYGAAIRRQWGGRILWYPKELQEVLDRCSNAPSGQALIDVLDLHESDAPPTITHRGGETVLTNGVFMDQGVPVGVSIAPIAAGRTVTFDAAAPIDTGSRGAEEMLRSSTRSAAKQDEPVADKRVWPRIDAPDFTPALKPFEVVVGFGAQQQAGVSGGQVVLDTPAETIDLQVELSTGPGVQSTNGWSRKMRVDMKDILSAQVSFQLVGSEPPDPRNPYLTALEVRYILDGTVCGVASRALEIRGSADTGGSATVKHGEAWKDVVGGATPITFKADEHAPDLTIEITKPDHNASSGHYMCQVYSPHALAANRGPFPMDLGQDAKTYAKALVDEVRLYARSELLGSMLEANGRLVAEKLPRPVFDALREVAAKVKPAVPTVLIVSAEPYVPWELAWIDAPLDPKRPAYLGAQAIVGRWLRDAGSSAAPSAEVTVQRPATHPRASFDVRNMAVMAAWYQADAGLRRLPKAEDEAKAIVEGWKGLPMTASGRSMRALLTATIEDGFRKVGGVEAVHFAGHGDFDPTRPDGSALFLEDGTPLRSTIFRTARYGGDQQPVMFLNACMLGIGGDVLGDMGGFPGNSLRGGFGGVIGALWEVNDAVAHDVAIEFWKRALPPHPQRGEPVGEILRDMRAKFDPDAMPAPVSTYLAYVYYGHPSLTLTRAAP